MVYSAQLIADYILAHSTNPLTPMHVIKITYISHGYILAITKNPLITERIEAWKYGPVIPALYHAYKGHGGNDILELNYCGTLLSSAGLDDRKTFLKGIIDPSTSGIVDQVIKIYSPLSALQLSALTHEKDTPWHQCYKPNKLFTLIPNPIIQKHYENKMGYGR